MEMEVRLDVLEEFASAQSLAPRRSFGVTHQPLASIQLAYRARRRELGLCRSCSREAAPGRASCTYHLHKNLMRAYASQERNDVGA